MPTRSIRWLVEHNRCRVNGRVERFCSTRLIRGDRVQLFMDDAKGKLETLFEDDYLVIYNKPAGMASEKLPHLLVHRLDRDTTGLIICAKTIASQNALEDLFRDRKVEKEYTAVVSPAPKEECGVIKMKMAIHKRREGAVLWCKAKEGLSSQTRYEVLKREKKCAVMRLIPKTGRTHQLRLHMKELGCPIVGDVDYGSKEQGRVFGQKLHASRLKFLHPFTGEHIEVKNVKY
ncbi:MAG: hypothetical protein S4CHLAM81_03970 [Chlamydiales bacterium]|nr:hypothetical protein [Chlamydiales bacterium]MCH9635186.1 hypothetical protein [Chlamydiales bacterium]